MVASSAILLPPIGRTLLALCLAPLLVAALHTLAGFIFYATRGDLDIISDLGDTYSASAILFLAIAVFGIAPFHAIAAALRRRSLLAYALGGASIGIALELFFWANFIEKRARLIHMPIDEELSHLMDGLIWFSTPVALTAIVFWLMRRPDRDAPNPVNARK